ncbi:MAG: redoxin domain-containing protein [Acidimicrobiia bacterium]
MEIDQAQLAIANDEAEDDFFRIWQQGPEVTRWDRLPVQVGDVAPEFTLPDQTGAMVSLDDLVRSGPVILLFWRHFGCGCGVDRAARLRDEVSDYRSTGATPVIVGQGKPIQAAAFGQEQNLDVPILTDPDRSTYRAYGLLDALLPQVVFDAPQWLWSYSEDTAARFIEMRRVGGRRLVNNPWLLPGEFVVDEDKTLRHVHRYQHCEDFPDPRILTTAVTGSSADGE